MINTSLLTVLYVWYKGHEMIHEMTKYSKNTNGYSLHWNNSGDMFTLLFPYNSK